MHTKVITSHEEFYNLKDSWERLQAQDPDATYYSTYKFNKTWWDVFSETQNRTLFIVCVYEGEEIIAIAPLMIEIVKKIKLSYRILKFLGRGDYFNFILDKRSGLEIASIKNILREIFTSCGWDRLQLTYIPSKSLLAYYFLSHRKYNKEFKYLIECPQIDFIKYNNFDEYKKNYNIDREFKYCINKLQKEVGYKFRVIKNTEIDIYERISKMHILEQDYLVKNKGKNDRESLFCNDKYSRFVKNIYKNNENVITFILEDSDSNLLCYYTCYYYKNVLYMWNTAYNPQYEKYSLTKIITFEAVKYIFENKLAIGFDFGAGRYFWKFKWTKDFILNYQFNWWNTGTKKGRFLKLIYTLKLK